jgi:hypothetical protein
MADTVQEGDKGMDALSFGFDLAYGQLNCLCVVNHGSINFNPIIAHTRVRLPYISLQLVNWSPTMGMSNGIDDELVFQPCVA